MFILDYIDDAEIISQPPLLSANIYAAIQNDLSYQNEIDQEACVVNQEKEYESNLQYCD